MNIKALGWALGFIISNAIILPATSSAPTLINWDASSCPTGIATVTTIACDSNNNCYTVISEDVKLPILSLQQTFANLPPTNYTARASVKFIDGSNYSSAIQSITGLGDAPIPTPSPTPEPIPTSSPTPTPIPQDIPYENFKRYTVGDVRITGANGYKYSFAECCGWMMVIKPGEVENYLLPGQGGEPGAWGREFTFVNGVLVVFDSRAQYNKWYQIREDHTGLTLYNGTGETPIPPQNPIPTPSPVPTPSIDLKPVTDALALTNSMLSELLKLHIPAITVTCQITAVSSYTNGDQRLTVRCSPNGFVNGTSIKIIK